MWPKEQRQNVNNQINYRVEQLLGKAETYADNNQTTNVRIGILLTECSCRLIINNKEVAVRDRGVWQIVTPEWNLKKIKETLALAPVKKQKATNQEIGSIFSAYSFRDSSGLL